MNLLLLMFGLAFSVSAQQETNDPVAVAGKDGIYLFLTNAIPGINHPENVRRVIVEKSTRSGGRFQQAAVVTRAVDQNAFKRIAGENSLTVMAEQFEVTGEQGAWQYIQQHASLEDYGWLPLDLRFSEAVGVIWVDRTTYPARTQQVFYRVRYEGDNNVTIKTRDITAVIRKQAITNRPLSFARMEKDSLVEVAWQAPIAKEEEAFWGEIYRRRADETGYKKLSDVIMASHNERGDTIRYQYVDVVEPGHRYDYYIVPTNIAGLPGPVSDTLFVISIDINRMPLLANLEARDTTGGILLTWDKLPDDALYAGIIIERADSPEGEHHAIDTIDARHSQYMDTRLRPAVVYYYRLRLLGIRMQSTPPTVWASAVHKATDVQPQPPYAIRVTPDADNLRIEWEPVEDPRIVGYYVLRRTDEADEWETVSPLMEKNVFIDSYEHFDGRLMYHYAIQSLSVNDRLSEPSHTVFGRPVRKAKLPYPEGLVAASEPGMITLRWRNMIEFDEYISGYKIYRKIAPGGTAPEQLQPDELARQQFVNVATLSWETSWADREMHKGILLYAVTCVDGVGNESPASIVTVDAEPVHLSPPSTFRVRSVPDGIEISWNFTGLDGAEVIIYRRTGGQQLQQIGKVSQNTNQYIDRSVSGGNLYQYAIGLEKDGAQSEVSLEKAVRK